VERRKASVVSGYFRDCPDIESGPVTTEVQIPVRSIFMDGMDIVSVMDITVFWDVSPCSLVDRYKHLGATCCLLKGGGVYFSTSCSCLSGLYVLLNAFRCNHITC
jgi:hypothetical protein